jgi:hypothetical protein
MGGASGDRSAAEAGDLVGAGSRLGSVLANIGVDETLRFLRALHEMGARRVAVGDVRVDFSPYVSQTVVELEAEAEQKRAASSAEDDAFWSAD